MRVCDTEYMKGVTYVSARVAELLKQAGKNTPGAVERVCLDIQARAQEVCPVESGALVGSAYTRVETEGDTIVGEIHFPEEYAARQHENMTFKHAPGKKAKYLELALLQKKKLLQKQLADAVSNALGGG